MSDRETTLDEHSPLVRQLVENIAAFVDECGDRSCTALLESVTTNGKYLKGKQLTQKPERFVEDHLVFPILRTLGHTVRPRPIQYAPRWKYDSGVPDFALTTIPVETAKTNGVRLFGEVKAPNKLQYADSDVKKYLRKDIDYDAIVILTDGIEWELWIRPEDEPLLGDDADSYDPDAAASLREALGSTKLRNIDGGAYHPYAARNELDATEFEPFTASALRERVAAMTSRDIDE